ncbi:MAG: YcxB family protein [Clostridiales bacterium]|jgi:hypothetical protein|nr:YcxB family protein [Clostridiales bacterium]
MCLKYNLTEQDWIIFNIYHSRHSGIGKKLTLFSILLPVAIILIFLLPEMFVEGKSEYYRPILLISTFLMIIAVCLAQLLFRPAKGSFIQRLALRGKFDAMTGEYELRLLDGKIILAANKMVSEMKYSIIENLVFNNGMIYVYTGKLSVIIVPDSVFADKTERQAFIDMIRQKIGIVS